MLRALGLRYFILATLVFSMGAADIALAATDSSTHQLHRQDLGDDDGDGIPNYLDPDDNNDGVLDSDTPAPTPTPMPPTPPPPTPIPPTPVPTNPAETETETPAEDDSNLQIETPVAVDSGTQDEPDGEDDSTDNSVVIPEEIDTPEQPVEAAPPVASEPVAQVSALPDTGSGPQYPVGQVASMILLLAVLTSPLVMAYLEWKRRMS